jgi:hypothetical protein
MPGRAAPVISDWSVKRRIEYVAFARKVAAGLRGVNESLEEQFEEAARAAERSFRPATSMNKMPDRLATS